MHKFNILIFTLLIGPFLTSNLFGQYRASLQSSIGALNLSSKDAQGNPIRWSEKTGYDHILVQTNELLISLVNKKDFQLEIKAGTRVFEYVFRDKQQQASYSWTERTADYRFYSAGIICGVGVSLRRLNIGNGELIPFIHPTGNIVLYNSIDAREYVKNYLEPGKVEKFRYRNYESILNSYALHMNIQAGIRYTVPIWGVNTHIFLAAEGFQFDAFGLIEGGSFIENLGYGIQCGIGVQLWQKT